MNITPTLINYYFHCKTQCWLSYNKLNMEHTSSLVRVGTSLHKVNRKRVKEVRFNGFSVDKIVKDYVIEIKKSDSDLIAGKWQLLYYLYKLKELGIIKKGRLEVFEKYQKNTKRQELILDRKNEQRLLKILQEVQELLAKPKPPKAEYKDSCKGCSYFEYCFI